MLVIDVAGSVCVAERCDDASGTIAIIGDVLADVDLAMPYTHVGLGVQVPLDSPTAEIVVHTSDELGSLPPRRLSVAMAVSDGLDLELVAADLTAYVSPVVP